MRRPLHLRTYSVFFCKGLLFYVWDEINRREDGMGYSSKEGYNEFYVSQLPICWVHKRSTATLVDLPAGLVETLFGFQGKSTKMIKASTDQNLANEYLLQLTVDFLDGNAIVVET